MSALGPGTLTLAMHLLNWVLPFNLIVTNVPGPQHPLYLLGARLVDVHPHVPLFPNQGLGVALFSYAGKLCWGFNADRDLVPDLSDFRRYVSASFDELLAVARHDARLRRTSHVGEPSLVEHGRDVPSEQRLVG